MLRDWKMTSKVQLGRLASRIQEHTNRGHDAHATHTLQFYVCKSSLWVWVSGWVCVEGCESGCRGVCVCVWLSISVCVCVCAMFVSVEVCLCLCVCVSGCRGVFVLCLKSAERNPLAVLQHSHPGFLIVVHEELAVWFLFLLAVTANT